MEYAKDIILSVGYKRISIIRSRINQIKSYLSRTKEFVLFVFCILKKWISKIANCVKRNPIISIAFALLITFMIADFILIDNFMKIFATLY